MLLVILAASPEHNFSQLRLGTQKLGNFQSSRCKERLGPQIFVVIQNLTELWTSILRRLTEQGRLNQRRVQITALQNPDRLTSKGIPPEITLASTFIRLRYPSLQPVCHKHSMEFFCFSKILAFKNSQPLHIQLSNINNTNNITTSICQPGLCSPDSLLWQEDTATTKLSVENQADI